VSEQRGGAPGARPLLHEAQQDPAPDPLGLRHQRTEPGRDHRGGQAALGPPRKAGRHLSPHRQPGLPGPQGQQRQGQPQLPQPGRRRPDRPLPGQQRDLGGDRPGHRRPGHGRQRLPPGRLGLRGRLQPRRRPHLVRQRGADRLHPRRRLRGGPRVLAGGRRPLGRLRHPRQRLLLLPAVQPGPADHRGGRRLQRHLPVPLHRQRRRLLELPRPGGGREPGRDRHQRRARGQGAAGGRQPPSQPLPRPRLRHLDRVRGRRHRLHLVADLGRLRRELRPAGPGQRGQPGLRQRLSACPPRTARATRTSSPSRSSAPTATCTSPGPTTTAPPSRPAPRSTSRPPATGPPSSPSSPARTRARTPTRSCWPARPTAGPASVPRSR
jgi:hypothetical protein